jgi:hypothetical protein
VRVAGKERLEFEGCPASSAAAADTCRRRTRGGGGHVAEDRILVRGSRMRGARRRRLPYAADASGVPIRVGRQLLLLTPFSVLRRVYI